MMRTVGQMGLLGGVQHFAMVHDSYAVHAADTVLLCRTVKEELSKMYLESDILGNLERDILENVPPEDKICLPARPTTGDLDLSLIPTRANFSFI
jgi:DNA-directed RNA polymerase